MTDNESTFFPLGLRVAARAALFAGVLAAGMGSAFAQLAFDAPDANYRGQVRTQSTEQGQPILPGSEVRISGQNFRPGQEISLLRGLTPLSPDDLVADGEGRFEIAFTLPEDAAVGVHPVVLVTRDPYHAAVVDLKVSPDVPLSGADKFEITGARLVPGLYQSAYSQKSGALFVTAAVGRPPVSESALLKLDAETLEIVAQATPGEAPAQANGRGGGLYAVYGVGVDEENGTVWVTNTRQDTVAVYSQDDLSLLKQFEPGAVPHARDVVAGGGKVFASPIGVPMIAVFDGKSLEFVENIDIASGRRGQQFSPASLQYDAGTGKLFAVSLSTAEVAIIDAASGAVDKVVAVEGARGAIGVDYDAETGRIFVAAQGSDNLLIVDAESGETLHDVPVGAGAINVAFEPVGRLAYVSNRGAGTVTVVDPDGNIVANLENSPLANHVAADGRGNIYAINKSRGPEDETGDRITRITPLP